MNYDNCIKETLQYIDNSMPMSQECADIMQTCLNRQTITQRDAFSILQKDTTIVYDVCRGKEITTYSHYDLNHYFGSITIVFLCILLVISMIIENKQK